MEIAVLEVGNNPPSLAKGCLCVYRPGRVSLLRQGLCGRVGVFYGETEDDGFFVAVGASVTKEPLNRMDVYMLVLVEVS